MPAKVESRRLRWNSKEHGKYLGKFSSFRELCEQGSIFCGPTGQLMWEFPIEHLTAFEEVFVLTYLFAGSLMASLLRSHGVSWNVKTLHDGKLVDRAEVDDRPRLRKIADLITIYSGPSNAVGNTSVTPKGRRSHALSASWYDRDGSKKVPELKGLRGSTEHFFRRVAKTPSKLNGWTTFKRARKELRGDGYTRGYIASNAKATNDYARKTSLAYLINVFPHPVIVQHLSSRGVAFDQDAYALSEMVQWIWRSAIRNDEPIQLFIPAARMRTLLTEWLRTGEVAAS